MSILRAFSFTCTPAVCHRDAFNHTCFYTEIFFLQRHLYTEMHLHRVAFTHRNDFLHTNTFTERWFYIEQIYTQMPKQAGALLQRNAFARGAFTYQFCTDILLPDFWRRTCIWRKRVQQAYAKSEFYQTHFVWKGWPSTNPHCNLASMYDDRHVVQERCVSWTSIHAALA